ncbi:MAG: AraC family transcriptional regulator [Cytophagia bacterium]|nr:MAG: AraC family transcriptional regulator [Cytophagia bacterium]TAG42320.1 MAG: AraC family transcriptional regulator [Cytophagia bacterium]TAH31525.1 MAG: AraC family transcriptional regulator [Cytophagales bacterium]
MNFEKTNADKLPKNSNLVNFSFLKEFYSKNPFRSFSIKYVDEGDEKYSVNGHIYTIKSNQYLLANQFSEGFAEVDSKQEVKGICIDINPTILSETVASFRRPDTFEADVDLDIFFNTTHFLENCYTTSQTNLGFFLNRLKTYSNREQLTENHFNLDFYYTLCEHLVADHIPIYKQLQSIKSIKTETKKELLRRVAKGKNFIDNHFIFLEDIQQVAKEAMMSEYHFFRVFKNVYRISPYQYILQKRLAFAKKKLLENNDSIVQIAFETNFSDVHSFSKAFKKHFGYPPSHTFNCS